MFTVYLVLIYTYSFCALSNIQKKALFRSFLKFNLQILVLDF